MWCKTYTHSDDTHRKPQTQISSFFFQCKLQYFTGLSRVRIALYHVLAASYRYPRKPPVGNSFFFAIFWFWGKMGFWSHNFGSRHSRRSIECCIDADDHLVSKNSLRQKNGSLVWRPGPVKVGQKFKPPTLWPPPRRTSNPNQIIFLIETRRVAASVEGLNSSLAIATGELWPKKCRPLLWPARALKPELTKFRVTLELAYKVLTRPQKEPQSFCD